MGRSGWMVSKIFLSFASLVLAFSWETAVGYESLCLASRIRSIWQWRELLKRWRVELFGLSSRLNSGDVLQKLLAMSLSSFRNQKEVCRIYIIVILGAILPASALQVLV